jgi:hypothetical protein
MFLSNKKSHAMLVTTFSFLSGKREGEGGRERLRYVDR